MFLYTIILDMFGREAVCVFLCMCARECVSVCIFVCVSVCGAGGGRGVFKAGFVILKVS